MKRIQQVLIIFLLTSLGYSQTITEEELAGKWVVQKVLKSPDIPEVKPLIDGFGNATFDLKGNADFILSTTHDSELFWMVTKMTENGKWRFDSEEQLIQIGTENLGYSIMGIMVRKIDDRIIFELQESEVVLEVIAKEKYILAREELKRSTTSDVQEQIPPSIELVYRNLDSENVVPFELIDEPPLAPDCKPKWSVEKKRKCTKDFIIRHVQRKFNTDLAGALGLSGRIRLEIEFVIDKEGDAINAKGSGGPEPMNQNGAEIISLLPKFKPGFKNGSPTNVSYKLPVIFQVYD